MEPNRLLIMELKGVPGQILGLLVEGARPDIVEFTHGCTLTKREDTDFILTPAAVPMELMGESFGDDALSFVNRQDLLICTSVDMHENSPHQVVTDFVQFWGLGEAEKVVEKEKVAEKA
jgi:hypothetical protein